MLSAPRLIVFSDTTRVSAEGMLARFASLAHEAQPGGVLFTLRDYGLSARARLALGAAMRSLAVEAEQAFGVADRADLARALHAHALHLPERGVDAADARQYLGPHTLLSRACHDPQRAADPGVDAVVLSPIIQARKGRPALGLGALEQARAVRARGAVAPALYALGGVDAGSAATCLVAGAHGVAVIGAALASDPLLLLRALGISRR